MSVLRETLAPDNGDRRLIAHLHAVVIREVEDAGKAQIDASVAAYRTALEKELKLIIARTGITLSKMISIGHYGPEMIITIRLPYEEATKI